MSNTFGLLIKEWRGRRRMSQLDLGLSARVSARHVAFLETGRAKPSRSMVIQLSEALAIPRIQRNSVLAAAGYAPVYRASPLDAEEMQAVKLVIDRIFAKHEPFPAFAIDRHWHLVLANDTAARLLSALDVEKGDSLIDRLLLDGNGARIFENWPSVCHDMMMRLRTESAHLGGDAVLDKAAGELAIAARDTILDQDAPKSPIVPVRYYSSAGILSFLSTIVQFGTPEDIALEELRVEMLFPEDAHTLHVLETSHSQPATNSDKLPA